MNYKKIILGTFLSLSLGIAGSLSYQSLIDDTSTVKADENTLKVASKGLNKLEDSALDKVSFKDKVKMPKNTPFMSDNSLNKDNEVVEFDEVTEFGEIQQYHHYYIDKKTEGFIEFQVTDADVKPEYDTEAGFKIKETKLSNGTIAYYMDNTIYEFLYWQQDGLSYTLVAEKSKNDKSKRFNSNELEKIASSIQ